MCAQRNGPDWTDILSTLKEMETLHESVVVIHLWADGLSKGGQLYVCVSAHPAVGLLQSLGERPAVWDNWPNRSHAELSGLLHRLLIELDYKLSREAWEQRRLPET